MTLPCSIPLYGGGGGGGGGGAPGCIDKCVNGTNSETRYYAFPLGVGELI